MAEEGEEQSLLSDGQEKALALLPLFSAFLSVLGSGAILRWTVVVGRLGTSYERILFGLSVADISSSTVNALAAFLVPHDTSRRLWAVGNDVTCQAVGTLWQITTAGFLYSGMLSLYYLLTIRFGMTETTFVKYVEPGVHLAATGGPLVTGLIGLCLRVYGEVRLGPGCWTLPDREYGEMFGWIATAIPMGLTLTGVIGGQMLIYLHCRHVLTRSRRWTMENDRKLARLRNVAIQSLSYVAVFLMVNLWPIVLRVLDNEGVGDEARLYPLLVLQAVFLPIQGFFNCAVYVRPRYLRQRQRHPEQSPWQALRDVLMGAKGARPVSFDGSAEPTTTRRRRRWSFVAISRSIETTSSDEGLTGSSSHRRRQVFLRSRTRRYDDVDPAREHPVTDRKPRRNLRRCQSLHGLATHTIDEGV